MLMNGVSSPRLAIGGRHHHHHNPSGNVVALGLGSAGGCRASDASVRESFALPLRLWRLWTGEAPEKGSEEAAVAEMIERSASRRGEASAGEHQPGGKWVFMIARIKSIWTEKEQAVGSAEEGDRSLGCGNSGEEDGSERCAVADGAEEERMAFDRESFSRLLRKVSLVDADLYAKMAYLGSLAYKVSQIKAKNLLRRYGLRFVVSSLERGDESSAEEAEVSTCRSASSYLLSWSKNTSKGSSENEQGKTRREDTREAMSLPCEWYICDDDNTATRYFVIQGSETLASWQTNLLFEPVEFEGLNVPVHRGIYEAAKGMYRQMLPGVRAHLKSRGAVATFRFTGHSLGGSLALLVNLMLLIRGETPAASLFPVITFGAPSIMCGGDGLICKLGLPKHHVQNISMHRDIVPRAFSCNCPDNVALLLKAVRSSFRCHSSLDKQKLMYAPMGKLLILQPAETISPSHHLLPAGSGLYILGKSLVDSDFSEEQLQAATLAFLNSPHPIEMLADRNAYGRKGALYRDHDTGSYLRSVRAVICREITLIRKSMREQRRRTWWPLAVSHNKHIGAVGAGSAGATDSTGRRCHFGCAGAVGRGRKTSHPAHMFVLLLLPARLLLRGARSLFHFR